LIHYAKGGSPRVQQTREPQPPFWQRTTISPYSPDLRGRPLALDYMKLRAAGPRSIHVSIADQMEIPDLDRLPPPILIEACGIEESIYRRGERLLHHLPADSRPILLLSTEGEPPRSLSAATPEIIIAAWPPLEKELDWIAGRCQDLGLDWGLLIPVVFTITTDPDRLTKLAVIASRHGARFLMGVSPEIDQKGRRAIAEIQQDLDEETWATLFDADLDQIQVSTERHIASLAAERGIADVFHPWPLSDRSNAAAAAVLARVGTRMVRMDHDMEMGWRFLRASRRVATLGKELTRVAAAAPLSIVPELDHELITEALGEWLDRGSARYIEQIDERWRGGESS
jgi:hypothetical protein